MKRVVSTFICIVLLVSIAGAWAEEIRPYASELITSRSIVSNDDGGGKVGFTARIIGTDIIEQIGFSSIRIQKYDEDTDTWDTIKAVYSKYGYDTSVYSYSVSHNGISGEQYRCKVTFYAKNGSLSDTKYMTSNIVIPA